MDTKHTTKRIKLSANHDDLASYKLSFLEELPCELLWIIFEYTPPEALLKLRSTSRLIKARVSEYSMLTYNIPIVDTLRVISWDRKKTARRIMLGIEICVPKGKKKLFELRLLRNPPNELIQMDKWNKWTQCQGIRKRDIDYAVTLDLQSEGLIEVLEYLNECLGREIDWVTLTKCNDDMSYQALSKLLDGIKLEQLKISGSTLSKATVEHLLESVRVHAVGKLRLEAITIADPVRTLLDLSSIVRNIEIQQEVKNFYSRESSRRILFGAHNIDWAPIFVEMLSRKLDTLDISNWSYKRFLSESSADALRENLPKIGKRIYFNCTCKVYANELDYSKNDHIVFASNLEEIHPYLMIRHSSRNLQDDMAKPN